MLAYAPVAVQIDKQAADRCHRLGQTRLVTIHKLVSVSLIMRMMDCGALLALLVCAGT